MQGIKLDKTLWDYLLIFYKRLQWDTPIYTQTCPIPVSSSVCLAAVHKVGQSTHRPTGKAAHFNEVPIEFQLEYPNTDWFSKNKKRFSVEFRLICLITAYCRSTPLQWVWLTMLHANPWLTIQTKAGYHKPHYKNSWRAASSLHNENTLSLQWAHYNAIGQCFLYHLFCIFMGALLSFSNDFGVFLTNIIYWVDI